MQRCKTGLCALLFIAWMLPASARDTRPAYFPPAHEWTRVAPATVGLDARRVAAAIAVAQREAVVEPRDLAQVITDSFSPREPDFRLYGPTRPREDSAGLIIKSGFIVGEWGDLERVDMTFSVAKSYLSTIAALGVRDGLIPDLQAPAGALVQTGHFDSKHNAAITWQHLLQQTSDWQGTLWDVPDWADRPEGDDRSAWPNRELHAPGSHYKYNDVRVNLLAYALMQVWRKPLPQVLREEIMDPIGASPTWRWHGYENSWVTLDGQRMQSVSGGGHFGGGIFINTLDHARFGLLFLRGGQWNGERLLPADWLQKMRVPATARKDYGYMWWLNTDREQLPAAPETAYYAAGFGGNYIYIDEENDLLVILRWVPALDKVIAALLGETGDT